MVAVGHSSCARTQRLVRRTGKNEVPSFVRVVAKRRASKSITASSKKVKGGKGIEPLNQELQAPVR
jgi:hypothetical protein